MPGEKALKTWINYSVVGKMDDYDAFEAEMLEAGWTLDEIEAAWQSALEDMRYVSDYGIVYRDTDSFYVPDTWDTD